MRTLILLALCIVLLSSTARADQTGSVDFGTSLSTFNSSQGSYGPWVVEDLNVRIPPKGDFGFELMNRNSSDPFNPTRQTYEAVDEYHTWSKNFSSYALLSFGSGPPFATSRLYLEGDATVHKGLQFALGAGDSGAVGLGATRSLHVGATLYKGDGYVTIAYVPGWSQLIGYTQGYTLSVAFGHPGQTTETLFLGTGTESDVSLINPSNPSIAGERETGAALMIKHWLSPRLGFRTGYEYGTLNHAAGGQIYQRNTFDLGVFTSLGH